MTPPLIGRPLFSRCHIILAVLLPFLYITAVLMQSYNSIQLGCVVGFCQAETFRLYNKASTKVNGLPLVALANQNSSVPCEDQLACLTSYAQL